MTSKFLLALCGGLALSTPALAQANNAVEDFFKGKTIRIVVSSEPGGSYDGYSRLVARHLGKFLPGNPQFVVQNMPGAGGLVATNWLYNVAPKDGTVLGQIQRQIPLMQILGEQGTQFETAKFNWIGSMASEATICLSRHDSPVKTAGDLMKQELIVAGSGPNSSENIPTVLNNVLGTKFKVISGYPSQTAGTLAVERGEASGVCTTYSSLLVRNKHWFEGPNKVNILLQAGLHRHPDLPNVPLAMELATNPEDKALFELFDTPLQIGPALCAAAGRAGRTGEGNPHRVQPDGQGQGLRRREHQGRTRAGVYRRRRDAGPLRAPRQDAPSRWSIG